MVSGERDRKDALASKPSSNCGAKNAKTLYIDYFDIF